ncbi:MAG: saccharopine dehydrogenase, partial [Candidatus Aminicenantes bacterium]|nr:saccharopine dehydrogenase [Candidatus Aminicenantes bacterium]
YLQDGREVLIPAEKLFESYTLRAIEGLGVFEGYPNRNSLPYIDLYGVPETKTMLRGTLRYLGWCETVRTMVRLGLLDQDEKDWSGLSFAGFLRSLLNTQAEDLKQEISERLGIPSGLAILRRLEWLGLFSEEPLPLQKGSALDIISARMTDKLAYAPGERDMIILQHEFIASYPGNGKERIISTLIDFGIPDGDSSMSRTVGLPAAIGSRLILEGRIRETGVHIPVNPGIYKPILAELKTLSIAFKEKRETI